MPRSSMVECYILFNLPFISLVKKRRYVQKDKPIGVQSEQLNTKQNKAKYRIKYKRQIQVQ